MYSPFATWPAAKECDCFCPFSHRCPFCVCSTFPRQRKLKSFLPAQIKSQASDSKRPKWKKGAPAQCRKVQPSCVGILSCTMPSRIWPFLLIHGQPSSSGSQQGCWTSKHYMCSSKQDQWWREKAKVHSTRFCLLLKHFPRSPTQLLIFPFLWPELALRETGKYTFFVDLLSFWTKLGFCWWKMREKWVWSKQVDTSASRIISLYKNVKLTLTEFQLKQQLGNWHHLSIALIS